MIKGIIFDMDGVLVDSEPVILEASIRGLKEYGVNARHDDFKPFVGAGEDKFIGGVSEKYGVTYKLEMKKRVYEIYLDIVKDKIKLYDNVNKTIEKLYEKGYKLCLASSADMIKINANLMEAGIKKDYFVSVLGSEDVINKKPDPEIFLLAGKNMNIDNKNLMVIEDSINGIKAAKKANMKACAITTSFNKEKLIGAGADFVVDDIWHIIDILGVDENGI